MWRLPETPLTKRRAIELGVLASFTPLSAIQEYVIEPTIASHVDIHHLSPISYSLLFNSGDFWNAGALAILSDTFLTPRFTHLSSLTQRLIDFSLVGLIVTLGESIPNHLLGNYPDVHDIPLGLVGAAVGTLLHTWANPSPKRR